jgi:hypothetical protein
LVERLGHDTVCIDNLVAAVRAVTRLASHPKIHAMTGIDHREYYIQNTCGATRRMRSGQSGRPSNQ